MDSMMAKFSKILALMCVRNTFLEELHAGTVPVSLTGDYSDVRVIDAQGRVIPWNELSRMNDHEMKKLMKQIVSRIFSFSALADDPVFQEALQPWRTVADRWDDPEMDKSFLAMIEQRRKSDHER